MTNLFLSSFCPLLSLCILEKSNKFLKLKKIYQEANNLFKKCSGNFNARLTIVLSANRCSVCICRKDINGESAPTRCGRKEDRMIVRSIMCKNVINAKQTDICWGTSHFISSFCIFMELQIARENGIEKIIMVQNIF